MSELLKNIDMQDADFLLMRPGTFKEYDMHEYLIAKTLDVVQLGHNCMTSLQSGLCQQSGTLSGFRGAAQKQKPAMSVDKSGPLAYD